MQTSDTQNISLKDDYLPFLDGIRGLAAVWVICSHSLDLSSANLPILNRGDIAVMLFMIMSGFLMTYHYYVREDKEPWGAPRTWFKFYVRRFFRIAPLYYLLLAAFFIIGPLIWHWRDGLAHFYPDTAKDPSRYLDHSLENIAMHVTFLFGLSKDYVVRTTMPDWSITLEMQFYAVFPFLMLLFRRYYFVLSTIVLYVLSYWASAFLYQHGYIKPSVLPMAMKFFLIGMLLALFNRYRADRPKAVTAIVGALVLAWLTQEKFIMLIVVMIVLFLNPGSIGRPVKVIADMLGSRFARWLADMSYSAYLLHLGFMIPIAYFCARSDAYRQMAEGSRFLIIFLLTAISTYTVSALMFHFVEKNGILWGKSIVKRI